MGAVFRKQPSSTTPVKIIIFSVLCFFIISLMSSSFSIPVYADVWIGTGTASNVSDGTNTPTINADCSKYGANHWAAWCGAGVSWAFYKATQTTDSKVEFPYMTGVKFGLPKEQIVIPGECSKDTEGGGFWHYGVNALNAGYSGVFTDATGPQYTNDFAVAEGGEDSKYGKTFYGHWMTTTPAFKDYHGSNVSYNATAYVDQSRRQKLGDYYEFMKYGTQSEVLKDYNKVLKASGQGTVSKIPNNVWGFCYSPNLNSYYSASNASAQKLNSEGNPEGTMSLAMTYTKNQQTSVTSEPVLELKVGEWSRVVLSHRIFTKNKKEDATEWSMRRFIKIDGEPYNGWSWAGHGDYYQTSILSQGDWNGTAHFTKQDGSYWVPSEEKESDGNKYITRDVFNFNFKKPGVYEICEEITVPSSSSSYITQACAKINVTAVSQFYSKSNVANRTDGDINRGDYDSTNIVNHYEVATTDELALSPGQSTHIVFSHNIYSDQAPATTKYRVERTINSSPGFGSSTSGGYTITANSTSGASSGSTSSSTGLIDTTFTTEDKEGDYFIGSPRNYTDSEHSYALRDVYEATFNNVGEYTLCESVIILTADSQEVPLSAGCSRIRVGQPDTTDYCDDWKPASYTSSSKTSGTTSTISRVRNVTLGNNYTDKVYAKPSDKISWIHCYYPGVQKLAGEQATGPNDNDRLHGDHNSSLGSGGTTSNGYNSMSSLYSKWSNKFEVTSDNLRNPTNKSTGNYRNGTLTLNKYNGGEYSPGISDVKSLIDGDYSVERGTNKNKAGKTLVETIKTGEPIGASITNDGKHSWDCDYGPSCGVCGEETCTGEGDNKTCTCNSCYLSTCHHSNDYLENSYTDGTASSHADVLVPYNFVNTIDDISLSSSIVYAGETITINSANIQVRTRQNSVTNGAYATQVDDAKVTLIGYVISGSDPSGTGSKTGVGSGKSYNPCSSISGEEACDIIGTTDGKTLNASGSLNLGSQGTVAATDSITGFLGRTFNVYDATAGKYFCVAAAVYPYTVNGDTDMNKSGSNNWYVSNSSCAQIAKRPSLEIWGASLYSNGNIATPPATKRVVDGFYSLSDSISDGKANTPKNQTVFGSWVEQAIVSKGKVGGIASGASTGGPSSNDNQHTRNSTLGGSWEVSLDFCNYRSPLTMPNINCGASFNNPGGNIEPSTSDKSSLINMFKKDNDGAPVDYAYITDRASLGDTVIPSAELGDNKFTVIIDTDETFTINGNILYQERAYSSLAEIPKLVIHAKNIKIACNVTRVDAVLIADNVVNTCDNSDVNDPINSNPLKVFGTVITDKLIANRTYGAATGRDSAIPAEIIDYDSSLYLWSTARANTNTSGKSETVYQTELAPRY